MYSISKLYNKEVAGSKHVAGSHVNVLLLHHMRGLHEAFGGFIHAVREEVLFAAAVVVIASVGVALVVLSLN